jgi:2-amino-4-hydroxy-6-hydroxymethyldihydropteridine diphosphokinase
MHLAYLILGSNLGDKSENLHLAKSHIENQCGRILKASPIYQTAAWGKTDEPIFVNQVLFIETLLTPQALLTTILNIEQTMGRLRSTKYAARTIDIDILFYNRSIIQEANLIIPHPEIANRRFVLLPLAALVPNKIHPVYKKSIKDLLAACTDTLEVIAI